jgi:outer membrane autotransporter protein
MFRDNRHQLYVIKPNRIALAIGLTLSLFSLPVLATNYTSTVSPGNTTLIDGDTIETHNQQAIQDSSVGSAGIQLGGTGKIEINTTFDENAPSYSTLAVVDLSNGTANDLGNQSYLSAVFSDENAPNGKPMIGIYLNSGTDLTATNLTLKLTSQAANHLITGVQSNSQLDLGNGSSITVVGKSNAFGVRALGYRFDANNLAVDVTGSDAQGVTIANGVVVDLGQNSVIKATGSYTTYGINMAQNSSLSANGLTVIANGDANTASGSGIYMQGGNVSVDVKSDSAVYTNAKHSEAVYVFGNDSIFKADDNLTIVTTGLESQGAIAQGTNAVVDLGKNAVVTTYGDTTTNATNMRNYSSSAVMARNGGKVIIGDGSQITTFGNGFSNGLLLLDSQSQALIGSNVSIMTEGNGAYGILAMTGSPGLTAVSGLTVITKGFESTGVLSQNNASVDLGQNALVHTFGENAWAVELYGNGLLKADGSAFIAESASSDVIHAGGSSKAILTGVNGTTFINAAGGGNALNFTGSSQMQGSGKMAILGDIYSADNAIIELNAAENSHIIGAWRTGSNAISNLTLANGGRWQITDDSNITHLTLNGAVAEFSGSGFSTLQTQDLNGNGTFNLRVNVKDGLGDLLDITGNSAGNHNLSIINVGGRPIDEDYQHLVVQTADGAANFSLSHLVDVDGWQYDLQRGSDSLSANNWYLFRTAYMTALADAAINESRTGYLLNYSENQTLTQRMGELRRQTAEHNVWVKGNFAKYNVHSSGSVNGFTQKINGVQLGIDHQWQGKNADIFFGISAGFNHSNQEYHHGNGQIDSLSLGLYGSYLHQSGFYSDLSLRGNRQKEDINVRDAAGTSVTNQIETHGVWGSVEIGHRFNAINTAWYIEPQLQATFGWQNGGSSTASNGTHIEYQSYRSALGRSGLAIGYQYKTKNSLITPYATGSYLKEFKGKTEVRVGNDRFQPDLGDQWWSYGAGVNAQVNKQHHLYLQAEKATGGNFSQSYKVNVGYRLSW